MTRGRSRLRHSIASIIAIAVAVIIGGGCGSSAGTHPQSSRELVLERTQLVQVSNELRAVEGDVKREVSASRNVWPLIAGGLPQALPAALRGAVGRASASAKALPEPRFIAGARNLTGPAAGIAGLYESYERLAKQGWRLTEATVNTIAEGPPTVRSFERENSTLYIDAIYDGHFDLSLVGKSLTSAYEKLGGASAFGRSFPSSELMTLAAAYSIPGVRLSPHPASAAKEA